MTDDSAPPADPAALTGRALLDHLSLGYRGPKHKRLVEALAAVFDDSPERLRAVLDADTPLDWLLNRQRLGPIESADVWESFVARGLVPLDWLDDSRRVFGRGRMLREGWRSKPIEDAEGRDVANARSFPFDYLDAITFGANSDAIVACETLVRDALTLRWPPGAPPPDTILWRALPRGIVLNATARRAPLAAIAALLDEQTIRAVNARGVVLGGVESGCIFLSLAPVH